MNLIVNGERREVPEGCTAAQLLEQLEVPPHGIAVAVDGVVLPRTGWEATLVANASVEVLTAVQGG